MTGAEVVAFGLTGGQLAVVGAVAAGAGVQAYGQYQQGKQAQSQAKAQAAINLFNSKVAKRQAEAEATAARFESKQAKKRAKALKGRQRALIGASGVEVEGSPLLVQEDTAAELATEVANIRVTGQRRVKRFESQSILDISAASAAKARARGFGQAADIGAGATILQGAGQAGFTAKRLRE